MNKKENKGLMLITGILMIMIFVMQVVGSTTLSRITELQFLDLNMMINLIMYIVVIAFFYNLVVKKDEAILGIGVISLWGVINLMPMIQNIIASAESLMYSFETSTLAVLVYMISLFIMFLFIILMSLYFIIDKKETKNSQYFLTYGISVLIMLLIMIIFNGWLKLNGFADELTIISLFSNSLISAFYLCINVSKYLIIVLVIKERMSGYYSLMTYLIIWYILFIGKSLLVFMGMPMTEIVLTIFVYLVPCIFYTYALAMGLTSSIRAIGSSNKA